MSSYNTDKFNDTGCHSHWSRRVATTKSQGTRHNTSRSEDLYSMLPFSQIFMSHIREYLYLLLAIGALALLTGPVLPKAQGDTTDFAGAELQASNSRTTDDDHSLARQAIGALQRLRTYVICYRSRAEFESDGRLARVPLETFVRELDEVTAEIEPVLPKLHDSKLRSYLTNSLESYRDGAFWWSKLGQTRVVTMINLQRSYATTTPAERFLAANAPYTVVVNWRLADRYLLRAQESMTARANSLSPETPESFSAQSANRAIQRANLK